MKKDKRLLEHILLDANDILNFTKELHSDIEMTADQMVYKAVCMSIINIGQAAYELSDEFRRANSSVPWSAIISMRNRTAHGYHLLDPEAVWEVAKTDIPALRDFIIEVIGKIEA